MIFATVYCKKGLLLKKSIVEFVITLNREGVEIMDVNNLFSNTIQRLEKNLNIRSRKHDLIVSNIANKDTPGYKAFDLIVEEAINRPNSNRKFNLTTNTSFTPNVKGEK